MQILKILSKVEHSAPYLEWKKHNKNDYLVHLFTEAGADAVEFVWQVGYYNKAKDRITTFCGSDPVTVAEDQEVFKKQDSILPLPIEKVKIDVDKAITIADSLRKETYGIKESIKTIMILQRIKDHTMWNMTLLSQALALLHINVDACTGKIIHHELVSLSSFIAPEEKNGLSISKLRKQKS